MAIYKNLLRFLKKIYPQDGFTLVELVVVLGMIGVLLFGLIATLNPVEQYNKATDGTREHDLGQIQRALDAYFNDTGCYPKTLIFGSKWVNGSQVYMEKIPQDPYCAIDASKCYVYETDATSTCPQWNVLYSSLRGKSITARACPLSTLTSCVPSNYSSRGYNFCVVSGNVDCSSVSGYIIPGGGGGGGGGGTVTPTPPSGGGSGPIVCPGGQYYGCTGDNRCNSIAPSSQCSQNGGTVFCHCDAHCDQTCAFN